MIRLLLWIAGAVALSLLFGQLVALPLFTLLFLRFESRETWRLSMTAAAAVGGVLYGVFDYLLGITWLDGVLAPSLT